MHFRKAFDGQKYILTTLKLCLLTQQLLRYNSYNSNNNISNDNDDININKDNNIINYNNVNDNNDYNNDNTNKKHLFNKTV